MRRFLVAALLVSGLTGCGPSYSPDTYASSAVQQANKVEQGVVVGVRKVGVSALGAVGAVTGAAAGGIAGSQAVPSPLSAFTALGGSLVGGIAGSAAEHTTADTTAFEYIVRKGNGDLVSVTQKDRTPLALGQQVLVIAGNQARVVPDYTVPPPAPTAATAGSPSKPDAAPNPGLGAPEDTKPAEPAKADAESPARTAPARETNPATTPAPVPATPAQDTTPGHTT